MTEQTMRLAIRIALFAWASMFALIVLMHFIRSWLDRSAVRRMQMDAAEFGGGRAGGLLSIADYLTLVAPDRRAYAQEYLQWLRNGQQSQAPVCRDFSPLCAELMRQRINRMMPGEGGLTGSEGRLIPAEGRPPARSFRSGQRGSQRALPSLRSSAALRR